MEYMEDCFGTAKGLLAHVYDESLGQNDDLQMLAILAIGYALVALVEELRKDNVPDKLRQQVVSGDGHISGVK